MLGYMRSKSNKHRYNRKGVRRHTNWRCIVPMFVYVCMECAILFMYPNDDVEIGNPGIREDIKRDVTRTDSGNCKETQNANIEIYTSATYMISMNMYKNVYNLNDSST